MGSLEETQREIGALRETLRQAEQGARARRLEADALGAALERAERAGHRRETEAIGRRIVTLRESAAGGRAEAERLRGLLSPLVEGLAGQRMEELVAMADDHLPFLLFPVRLETKFRHLDPGLELRVRIFPDDISISSHDPLLTAAEQAAGTAYWEERGRAATLSEPDRKAAERGAWSMLAVRFGGPRARYVARKTQAASTIAQGDELPRTSAAPPRINLFPDAFVVTALDEAGNVLASKHGLTIPDTLLLMPDPEGESAGLGRDSNNRIAADPRLSWLIDYEAAVDVGMAVTLPMPDSVLRTGVHRLVALGTRLSLGPKGGGAAVEELLSDHRFTNGIDLLRQGSPTNNSEGTPSRFATGLDVDETLVEQEVDGLVAVGILDHDRKTDAQRLAEALGIPLASIADWPSAHDDFDVAEALAMNRALWPATIGGYLDDLVAEAIDPPLRKALETFFLAYVTGRGLLPAIRVGAQPYGILATSDLRGWAEDRDGDDAEVARIFAGTRWMRSRFDALAAGAAQTGQGADPLATSLRVIGQLASSSSFATRLAVSDEWSWNTLVYEGIKPLLVKDWYEELQSQKAQSRQALGISGKLGPLDELTFLQESDPWTGPVVDDDPRLPLSETLPLTAIDGTRNYIDWLLTATTDELRSERIKGPDGQPVPAPKALLYRLLHRAWSRSLVRGATELVSRLRPELVASVTATSLNAIGPSQHVPDALSPFVDGSRLGIASNSRVLGDILLDASLGLAGPASLEALPVMSQRAALERLARLPTARLERALAEHLDLASYRLDAWQSGLVARRLDRMRRREGRAAGMHLGAYGYVEKLEAKPRPSPVGPETLPEGLRDSAPVVEQAGNGGFVHAPSLGQAVTAAVLRNAYLTHSSTELGDIMGVNLTSRRVRLAMDYLEGIRAGQELGALLGYQFERGLHERHPGLELDAFTYVLRARFPLVSNRLAPVPDGVAAELVEARNVVDGYDMLGHVRGRAYPFGIDGLAAEGSPEALAIVSEIASLEEALDALADVLTAETVHQAAQSNMERARGTLGALADGDIPQLPDVIQTPRSGRIVTQRVALHLAGSEGWLAAPTARARANPGLNAWLAAQLPPPTTLGLSATPPGGAPQTVTLDACGLEPVDLILMSSDRFGDGSSELERWIADRCGAALGIDGQAPTSFTPEGTVPGAFVIDLASAAGVTPLADLIALLRALKGVIGGARGLDARDCRLPSETDKAAPGNPRGLALAANGDIERLPGRIGAEASGLTLLAAQLGSEVDQLVPLRDQAAADPSLFDPAAWAPRLDALRAHLRAIALHGLGAAIPHSAAGTDLASGPALVDQARAVREALAGKLERASEMLAPLAPEPAAPDPAQQAQRMAARLDRRLQNLADGAREVLGSNFVVQAPFALDSNQLGELAACLSDPIEQDALQIEAWLQGLARVRTAMADLAIASACAQWTSGREPRLVPLQLPRRPGDTWAAAGPPPRSGDVMSIVAIDPPAGLGGVLEGLLIDEWTELVPTAHETTGIAFQFDRPSAAAPQAILLAVPPSPDGRWQWSELMNVVTDTFDRARQRAVEPDQVASSPLFTGLPMTMMPFSRIRSLDSHFLQRDAVSAALTGD